MTSGTDAHFVLFGAHHVLTMLLIALLCTALAVAVRQTEQQHVRHRIALILGVLLLIHELARIGTRLWVYDQSLAQSLPLHLCGIESFLVAYMLMRRSYPAFEIAYFWGMGGTLQAIVTPDLEHGFPSHEFTTFFLGHGLTIIGVIYAIVVFRFRPTLRSVVKTIAITLGYTAFVGLWNVVFGTNYLYLRHKPEHASIMDYMGPWPWYILTLIFCGVVICLILYAPFGWLQRRPRPPPDGPRR